MRENKDVKEVRRLDRKRGEEKKCCVLARCGVSEGRTRSCLCNQSLHCQARPYATKCSLKAPFNTEHATVVRLWLSQEALMCRQDQQ